MFIIVLIFIYIYVEEKLRQIMIWLKKNMTGIRYTMNIEWNGRRRIEKKNKERKFL